MRMSKLFSQTLREAPADADIASHQLLLRAGFIRQLGAGIFTYLPLAKRSLTKIENIMRDEIEAIGGQEITMPVIHPADIWKETGRHQAVGAEMGRFKDRNDHDMVLAMTHEEVVGDLTRREVHSYRQLPLLIYHLQTKWRDDPRPRAGLIRVREFTMLDSYSLDRDWAGLDAQYQAHYEAYFRIFQRCGLPVHAVKSDTGMMGGKEAHEYMYLTACGEDTIIICEQCGYVANRQVALQKKPLPAPEAPKPVEKVATPQTKTIDELAALLNVPASKTAKAVFYMADFANSEVPRFVFAVLRGDMTLNETKLANALSQLGMGTVNGLRPALDEEIRRVDAMPGYASPIGIKRDAVIVVVDDLIPQCANLVAGANEEGYHLLETNYGRDYTADLVTDIAAADAGALCPNCATPMRAERGVEVGNIFKLGTRYSDALGCTFLDEAGKTQPVIMGSYGIGVGRLLACVVEAYHDEKGMLLPIPIAPYPIHLVLIPGKDDATQKKAEKIYADLCHAGLEPLFDDRDERAGVKFNDADLIGLPLRLTISERSLAQNSLEFKVRQADEKTMIDLDDLIPTLQKAIEAQYRLIAERFTG